VLAVLVFHGQEIAQPMLVAVAVEAISAIKAVMVVLEEEAEAAGLVIHQVVHHRRLK
jgi:hypothetical protein